MAKKKITWSNFVKPFNNFVKTYNEGLFGLVVALLTFALERILDTEVFECPSTNYQAYAIAFFVCPIVMLTLLNLLTVPADGGTHIWTLCESCWIKAYHRRGDVFSGFLSAFCVGLVAPTAWVFLALLDAQHLVCWELGYNFDDNVTESYLKKRGFSYLTTERYKEKVDEAKARSGTYAVAFLGIMVVILCIVIIIRRSCLKPYHHHERLPSLCHFERNEAFAARDELNRLLNGDDQFKKYSDIARLLQSHFFEERGVFLQKELLETTDEKKKTEVELEIKEFERLKEIVGLWATWTAFEKKKDLKIIAENAKELTDAKSAYEVARDELLDERRERASKAKAILESFESSEPREEAEGEELSVAAEEAMYQTWLLTRLEQQEGFFDVDKLMESWGGEKNEVLELHRSLENMDHTDCPEIRGMIVSKFLIKLYRDNNLYCSTVEQVLEKLRSIYPRLATSNPRLRYVDVNNPMYKHIIARSSKNHGNAGGDADSGSTSEEIEDWSEQNNDNWKKYVKHNRIEPSCCWAVTRSSSPV